MSKISFEVGDWVRYRDKPNHWGNVWRLTSKHFPVPPELKKELVLIRKGIRKDSANTPDGVKGVENDDKKSKRDN